MSANISYHSYDYKPVKPVPVIASFDPAGHIIPLYVRIGEESLKIDSFWIKYAFSNMIEFNCKVICNGRLLPLLLTYYQTEGVWTIPE